MPGHSNAKSIFSQILWPDAEVESIEVNYDVLSIHITETTGRTKTVSAKGYIGYSLIGAWDEAVIERAEMTWQHAFIDECTRSIATRLGSNWDDSGSTSRNLRRWFALLIHLSDGAILQVVAAELEILNVPARES